MPGLYTGFQLWRQDVESGLARELEDLAAEHGRPPPTRTAVVRELAARWKALPTDQRSKYDVRAAAVSPAAASSAPTADDGGPAEAEVCRALPPTPPMPSMDQLEDVLLGRGAATAPVPQRMRAIYFLRTRGTPESVDMLCRTLVATREAGGAGAPLHSPLLRHEVGFVLGQLRDPAGCPTLEAVLSDEADDVMVRHECAEALGAIGAARSLPLLEALATAATAEIEIRQTCEVASDFCRWKSSGGEARGETRPGVACACMLSPYSSHDPAPADPATDRLSISEVGEILADPSRPLFERYGAMFALRNRGGELAVTMLARSLTSDQSSALLRHEVAYVLGQMQHPAAVPPLIESLSRPGEHPMVRHEAAEALGAIEFELNCDAGELNHRQLLTDRDAALHTFMDPTSEHDAVVRESCEVALDAEDYWSSYSSGGTTTDGRSGEEGGRQDHISFAVQKAASSPSTRLHFNLTET